MIVLNVYFGLLYDLIQISYCEVGAVVGADVLSGVGINHLTIMFVEH